MRRARDGAIYIYLALVILAVLPFGSVDPTPFSLVSAAMLILSMASALLFGEPRHGRWVFNTALAIVVVVSLWAFIQTLDLPYDGIQHPSWKDARMVTGGTWGSISVEPADTLAFILQLAMPFVTFLTGMILASSDERAEKMLRILGITGGLIAVWGLGQFLLFPKTLLFVEKRTYLDSLTAVFVNRNTAATFLGLSALILLTFAHSAMKTVTIHAIRVWITTGNTRLLGPKLRTMLFYLLLLGCCVVALLLTKSRAGVGSTVVAMLFLVPFLMANQTKTASSGFGGPFPSRWKRIQRIGFGIAIIVIIAFVFAGRVILRAEQAGTDDPRFCVVPGIWNAIRDNWLLGTGFGAFRDIFPAYRDAACGISSVWERAHNFYLEGFLGLGVLFPIATAIAIRVILRVLVAGMKERRNMRGYAALGFAAFLLVAVHASLDFSLQIPGFAAYFAAFFAPVAVISLARGKSRLSPGPKNSSGNRVVPDPL